MDLETSYNLEPWEIVQAKETKRFLINKIITNLINDLNIDSYLLELDNLGLAVQSTKDQFCSILKKYSLNNKQKQHLILSLYNYNKDLDRYLKLIKYLFNETEFDETNDFQKLNKLLKIAKIVDEPKAKETLLRKLLIILPDNILYQIDLAKSLIKQYHRSSCSKHWKSARTNPKLIEAENILMEAYQKDNNNFEAVKFLRIIAHLQNKPTKENRYLNLLDNFVKDNPDNKSFQSDLVNAKEDTNKNYAFRLPKKDPDYKPYIEDITLEDFTLTKIKEEQKVEVVDILYIRLINELNKEWNPQTIREILYLILAEETLKEDERKRILALIDKTKSKRKNMLFSVKGEVISLTKIKRLKS